MTLPSIGTTLNSPNDYIEPEPNIWDKISKIHPNTMQWNKVLNNFVAGPNICELIVKKLSTFSRKIWQFSTIFDNFLTMNS